jgi:hypothetical protein
MRATALLAAFGLGMIDVVFVARRVINPVYLLNGVAEAAFVAGLGSGRALASSHFSPPWAADY